MSYKPRVLEISNADPFKNDGLERKHYGEVLAQFVNTIEEPFVLAIDSPWGTGKSTFLSMWRGLLHNNGFKTIYFNAWETDFSDSPLLSLLAEVDIAIKELPGTTAISKTAFDAAKSIGKDLAKAAIPAVIKFATHGTLDLAGIKEEELSASAEEFPAPHQKPIAV